MPTNNAKIKVVYISPSSYASLVTGGQTDANALYIIHDENNSGIDSKVSVGNIDIADDSEYALHVLSDLLESLVFDFIGSGEHSLYIIRTDSLTAPFEFDAPDDLYEGDYIVRWQGNIDESLTNRSVVQLYKVIAEVQSGQTITPSDFWTYLRSTDVFSETQFTILSGGNAASFS